MSLRPELQLFHDEISHFADRGGTVNRDHLRAFGLLEVVDGGHRAGTRCHCPNSRQAEEQRLTDFEFGSLVGRYDRAWSK